MREMWLSLTHDHDLIQLIAEVWSAQFHEGTSLQSTGPFWQGVSPRVRNQRFDRFVLATRYVGSLARAC